MARRRQVRRGVLYVGIVGALVLTGLVSIDRGPAQAGSGDWTDSINTVRALPANAYAPAIRDDGDAVLYNTDEDSSSQAYTIDAWLTTDASADAFGPNIYINRLREAGVSGRVATDVLQYQTPDMTYDGTESVLPASGGAEVNYGSGCVGGLNCSQTEAANRDPAGNPILAIWAAIAGGGRYVAFVGDDWHVYLRDTAADTTERLDVGATPTGLGGTAFPAISADGRYVAWISNAPNQVAGDTNGSFDAFLVDRQTDVVERVSIADDEAQANGHSTVMGFFPIVGLSVSDDGNRISFSSMATNLVPGDTNGLPDDFVRDRTAGTTRRVSEGGSLGGTKLTADGSKVLHAIPVPPTSFAWVLGDVDSGASQTLVSSSMPSGIAGFLRGPDLSPDGRYAAVAIADGANSTIVRVDSVTGDVRYVSRATGEEFVSGGVDSYASMSDDGRYVAFGGSSGFVPGDTNGAVDVFVVDRVGDTYERVSVATGGTEGNGWSESPKISGDGRYVAFTSQASNLVAGDTNGASDVFVRDRQLGVTERVSVRQDGSQFLTANNPTISADGKVVAFSGKETPAAHAAYVRDRSGPVPSTARVDLNDAGVAANGDSFPTSISADGRRVAFLSTGSNLAAVDPPRGAGCSDNDVFVRDRVSADTYLVSESTGGQTHPAIGSSWGAISPDGEDVVIVVNPCGGAWGPEIWLREGVDAGPWAPQTLTGYKYLNEGPTVNDLLPTVNWSRNGRFVAFSVHESGHDAGQVFVHDLLANTSVAVSRDNQGYPLSSPGDPFGTTAAGISSDGSAVLFLTNATNIGPGDGTKNVYVRERPAFASTGDTDDLPDAMEDAAPNSGDGNGDGTRDALQSNVASFPSAGLGSPYTTLESAAGTSLEAVGADPTPGGGPALATPLGSFTFELHGITPGATATLNYYMPTGTNVTTLYKFDGATWSEFGPGAGGTGAVVAGDVIHITLKDGGRGDSDGVVDGKIVDPAIPARPLTDSVSVSITGGLAYTNSAPLASGNVEISPATGLPSTVSGSGTIPSTVSGNASVAFSLRRFFIFNIYVGTIYVTDAAAGLSTTTMVLFRSVTRGPDNSVSGSAPWFKFANGRFLNYWLNWSVADGD